MTENTVLQNMLKSNKKYEEEYLRMEFAIKGQNQDLDKQYKELNKLEAENESLRKDKTKLEAENESLRKDKTKLKDRIDVLTESLRIMNMMEKEKEEKKH
jgi:cell division protein FtsB